MTVEFWVMRVVVHYRNDGGALPDVGTLAALNTNAYALHPDGHIMEPIEVWSTEHEAHEHRAKLMRDNPGEDYRVILNADCPV